MTLIDSYNDLSHYGISLADEPIHNGQKRSIIHALALKAKQKGKMVHLNLSGGKRQFFKKYLTETTNSGGIYDSVPTPLTSVIDIFSVNEYGCSSCLSYEALSLLILPLGKTFMVNLGESENSSIANLTNQKNRADWNGATVYGFWSMTGMEGIQSASIGTECQPLSPGYSIYQGNKVYEFTICYDYGNPIYFSCTDMNFIMTREFDFITRNWSDCDSQNLNYNFGIKSIVISRPNIWSWFSTLN